MVALFVDTLFVFLLLSCRLVLLATGLGMFLAVVVVCKLLRYRAPMSNGILSHSYDSFPIRVLLVVAG